MKKLQFTILFSLLLFAISCKKDKTEEIPPTNEIDLSSYVALGNSLTAGYSDGALYTSGQEYSYANILANQFSKAGGNGIFKTPIIPTEDGVYPKFGQSGLQLFTKFILTKEENCQGIEQLIPIRAVENPDQEKLNTELFTNISSNGPFNNLGVPGITVSHMIIPGMGAINPYYGRFAVNPSSDKLIDEAKKVNPTFFSLWIGNNDVLGYATSGGTTPITNSDLFQVSYDAVISHLCNLAESGILANIPDITSAAFFTSVDYDFVELNSQEEVDELQDHYLDYNQQMELWNKDYRINWTLGKNPMLIRDKNMDVSEEYKIRQMTENELALFSIPNDSLLCANWGTLKPLSDEFVLTETEIEKANNAVIAFNEIIAAMALKYDLAFIDFNSLMKEIANGGITENGVTFTSEFIFGNLFSLDGIHLTPQGNALVANKFIETINNKYSTSIPKVNITDYPEINIP
jgi:hypothetical protein